MADLRGLFGSNDRSLIAQEAFTNRAAQWDALLAALGEHLQQITDPSFDVEDVEAPRRNVLAFYGVGGAGKTTLSRRIESALASEKQRPAHWAAPTWTGSRLLPIRIDVARSAGTDFEQLILTLRLALARLGRPFPAFDLAFLRYWQAHHPGEELAEHLRRRGLATRFGQMLPEQLQAVLGDIAQELALPLPGALGAAVGQVTRALVRALREHRQTVRALAGCTRLADLLDADPDLDALSYYPHLLAWELAQLPASRAVMPVVLLDTFEDLGDRTHRDLERLLQRVVWLMPNALFVITGRNRLRWADAALTGLLDWTGPAAWPGLAPTGDRQILVGDLSSADCEDYLARRLTRDGRPLIGPDVRETIVRHSHGLPLHLDLSVARFLELQRHGRTPRPADFEHDFPALIARTMADLSPDERHVLRAVTLLDAFDIPLATAVAGMSHEAAARRLTERPLVREDPYGLWPYHLHSLIRSTIRYGEDPTDDAWSGADWRHAAERALAALGDRWIHDSTRERRLLVDCLRQALAIARDFHLELGWLIEAAWAYVDDSIWEPLDPPARHDAGESIPQTPADALVELLAALARRQHEHRSRTAARLTAVRDARLLPTELQEMAVYYLAKAHRDLGMSVQSRHGMQLVVDGGGRRAAAARRGLAHLAREAGDFPTAFAAAQHLGWAGRAHRVLGDLWWPHGEIAKAATAYTTAREQAEAHGIAGERAIAQTHLALVLAFGEPARADDELDLAQHLLAGLTLRSTELTTQIAALLRDAGSTTAGVVERAHLLRSQIEVAGLPTLQPLLALALAFHHAIEDSPDQLAATITQLRELTTVGDYAYYVDIAQFMGGLPLETPSPARWLDGPHPTRRRWRTLVTARRELTTPR